MRRLAATLLLMSCIAPALAALQDKSVEWTLDDTTFSGVLVHDDLIHEDADAPAVLMFPNWMGVTDEAIALARDVASGGYTVLVADMYGKDVRPKDDTEAREQVMKVYADGGTTLRRRAAAALDALKAQADGAPIDTARIGAIGFCFGGSGALELARSGADLAGVVSFHGGLQTHLPTGGNRVHASVLVLNGADDTSVTAEHIAAFEQEMDAAGADWQFVNFSGAVHCFSQPEDAGGTGNCRYDERAAGRAFEMMRDFFRERFASGRD
jgi:dienelactone hydrolase